MSTYSNSAREVEMPDGNVVVLHKAPTGGANTTSNIKKFKYDDNGHVTESTAADAEDLSLSGYSTPTTGTTAIGTSDDVQTAIGKLDHQSHIDQTNILLVQDATEELVDKGAKNIFDVQTPDHTRDTSIVPLANGGITISCTNALWTQYRKSVSVIPNKSYRFMIYVDNISQGLQNFDVLISTNETTPVGLGQIENIHATGAYHIDLTPTTDSINVLLFLNNTETAKTQSADIRVLLCSMAEWKISLTYQPYALPNYDLTQLEQQDRNALVEVVDEGAKNKFDLSVKEAAKTTNITVTKTANSITVTSNTSANEAYVSYPIYIDKAGKYVITATFSNVNLERNTAILRFANTATGGLVYTLTITDNGTLAGKFDISTAGTYWLLFAPNWAGATAVNTYTASDIMVCSEADWNVSQNYASYALPNTDLTQLEAEDRAALAEVVDSGAKNVWDFVNAIYNVSSGSHTKTDESITVTSNNNTWRYMSYAIPIKAGEYVYSCKISDFANTGGLNTANITFTADSAGQTTIRRILITANDTYTGTLSIPTDTTIYIFYFASTDTADTTTFKASENMICTLADWKISPKYVPHRPDYDTLISIINAKEPALSTITMDSGSLDDITTNSFIVCSWEVASKPISTMGFVRTSVFDANSALQEFYSFSGDETQSCLVYVRDKQAGVWRSWKMLTNNT